jgi:hypothetical protein
MERYIDQFYVVDELSKRTGYYKYQVREVLEQLEDIILENMQEATLEQPSETRLFFGFTIGAKRIPAKQKRGPKDIEPTYVPEHINPYVKFKTTFKQKANNYEKEAEHTDDGYVEKEE